MAYSFFAQFNLSRLTVAIDSNTNQMRAPPTVDYFGTENNSPPAMKNNPECNQRKYSHHFLAIIATLLFCSYYVVGPEKHVSV